MPSLLLTNTPNTTQPPPFSKHISQWQRQIEHLTAYNERPDTPLRWQPASDESSGLYVLLVGRIALDAEQWQQASELPFSGGHACRWILQQWLTHPPKEAAASLNGNFGVCVIDSQKQHVHILTDRCGATPIYISPDSQNGLLLGTDIDCMADLLQQQGTPATIDKVSLAQTLASGSCSAPHTYYTEIQELKAASHHHFNFDGQQLHTTPYWEPQVTSEPNREDDRVLAEALTKAVRRAIARRTNGQTGLLLSGGADSRALLFAASTPSSIDTVTFFDQPNAELKVAQQLAAEAGAKHTGMQRHFDHYGKAAHEAIALTNGMWSFKDIHYHNFHSQLADRNWDNLLTGCYADYLLKGLAFNTEPRRVLGRPIPLKKLADYAPEFYQPHADIAATWQARAYERTKPKQNQLENPSTLEDSRVRPLSREADAMGRLYLQRTLPWDPVFLDNEILEIYQRLSPSQKLNSKVFRLTVHNIVLGIADHIPNNNDGVALNASDTTRILKHFQRRLSLKWAKLFDKFKGKQINQPLLATSGSWPDFCCYVKNSDLVAALWSPPSPRTLELLTELLGYNPWGITLNTWGTPERIDLFLRLLTLKIWLEKNAHFAPVSLTKKH